MTFNLQNPLLISSMTNNYPPPLVYLSTPPSYVNEKLSPQNLDKLPIGDLKKQIIELTVEKKSLESRNLRLEKEIVSLRNQCDKHQSGRDVEKNLKNELAACKLQLERSEKELSELEEKLKHSEGRGSKRKRAEITKLNNQLRIVEERLASDKSYFQTTVKEEFEKRQKLGQELAQEKQRNTELQSRISLVREELNHVFGNAQELHVLIANLREENKKLKEELEKPNLEKETNQINS